jgi:branched-chain amino acid transport system substrate-binding protein
MKEMMRNSLGGRLWLGAVVSAVAVLAAACSSGSSNSGSSGLAQAGSATNAAAGAASAPSGAPVTVGVIYTANNQAGNTPGIQTGANAAAAYINSQLGGINGHPVKVLACNGMNAPENSTACATKFVNSGVVDVVGLDGLWGTNGQPIVAKAGIINQTTPLAAGEFIGPTSFPFDGGPTAGAGAVASYVLSKGWKSVACVYLDLASVKPSCDQAFAGPLKAAGVKYVSVPVPPTATDFAQYAQAATVNKPQAVLVLDGPTEIARFIQAASQLGVTTQYFAPNISASADLFNIGAPANGTIFYFPTRVWTDTADQDIKTFVAAMQKYAPGAAVNAESLQGFAGIMNVQRLGAKMSGGLTAAAFVTALRHLSDFQSFAGPVLNASDHLPGLANIYLTGAYLYTYSNGNFTLDGSGLTQAAK